MTEAANESKPKARICQWCGEEYHSSHHAKLYCSDKCKNDFGNMMTVIGKRIAAEAMAWRRARGGKHNGGADCFQRLCGLLDEANAEYVAARPKKAPSINDYIRARNGTRGIRFGRDR